MKRLIIGLTGPTGSGKSTLCKVAEELGFQIIDADKVAHKVTDTNITCKEELEKFFHGVLNPDGSLNRKTLAAKAFGDKASTEALNRITLPHIMKEIEIIINKSKDKVLLDAPTLYEAGANRLCNIIIGVLAPEYLRLCRIMARDGISEEAARLRISAGKPDEFYKENCDIIIENSGELSSLKKVCRDKLTKITEKFDET